MKGDLSVLVGKTVRRTYLSQDREHMVFELDGGEDGNKWTNESLWFYADADCCSHSWVEGFSGPTRGKVQAVNDKWWNDPGVSSFESDGTVIKAHFIDIEFEGKGTLTVEFRNSSNGYYDGTLVATERPNPEPTLNPLDEFE